MPEAEKLFDEIQTQTPPIIDALKELIRIPAIAPENGGDGEAEKAEKLDQILHDMGFENVEHMDAADSRVKSGKRPNLIVYCKGEITSERLWIITHLDVVPPGETSLWTVTNPYNPLVQEGKIYGRGSEDNMQSMLASILTAKVLNDLEIKPKRTLALAFVADEEQGSTYGIQYLIGKHLFKNEDLIIVPDSGNEDGSFIEIAEKSALWLRFRTIGRQAHASRPHTGLNAHRIAMQYALELDRILHEKYGRRNEYFDPPESTIEPTKKDRNVDAINIIPGEDTLYFDCRILPEYDLNNVKMDILNLAKQYETKTSAKIRMEIIQENIAPKPTDANSRIVQILEKAVKQSRSTTPKVGGIGGGTCAAFFREINIPAVVWSTIDETAHQPNEYAKIRNLVEDAKTFALAALAE